MSRRLPTFTKRQISVLGFGGKHLGAGSTQIFGVASVLPVYFQMIWVCLRDMGTKLKCKKPADRKAKGSSGVFRSIKYELYMCFYLKVTLAMCFFQPT